MQELEEKLKKVKIIVSDVDGVLTDGGLYLSGQEEEIKVFYSKDAPRTVIARSSGLKILLVTARECQAVVRRANEMKVDLIFKGQLKEKKFLDVVKEKYGLEPEEIAYLGDDWSDMHLMKQVGVAITPQDGSSENKEIADIITDARGGRGVMAEAVEKIMRAQGTWEKYKTEFFAEFYQK
jgi:3-deoxy-D-manno-octulosonate 8-phosphate phosphatase (KDO 8-P phosphatase)